MISTQRLKESYLCVGKLVSQPGKICGNAITFSLSSMQHFISVIWNKYLQSMFHDTPVKVICLERQNKFMYERGNGMLPWSGSKKILSFSMNSHFFQYKFGWRFSRNRMKVSVSNILQMFINILKYLKLNFGQNFLIALNVLLNSNKNWNLHNKFH